MAQSKSIFGVPIGLPAPTPSPSASPAPAAQSAVSPGAEEYGHYRSDGYYTTPLGRFEIHQRGSAWEARVMDDRNWELFALTPQVGGTFEAAWMRKEDIPKQGYMDPSKGRGRMQIRLIDNGATLEIRHLSGDHYGDRDVWIARRDMSYQPPASDWPGKWHTNVGDVTFAKEQTHILGTLKQPDGKTMTIVFPIGSDPVRGAWVNLDDPEERGTLGVAMTIEKNLFSGSYSHLVNGRRESTNLNGTRVLDNGNTGSGAGGPLSDDIFGTPQPSSPSTSTSSGSWTQHTSGTPTSPAQPSGPSPTPSEPTPPPPPSPAPQPAPAPTPAPPAGPATAEPFRPLKQWDVRLDDVRVTRDSRLMVTMTVRNGLSSTAYYVGPLELIVSDQNGMTDSRIQPMAASSDVPARFPGTPQVEGGATLKVRYFFDITRGSHAPLTTLRVKEGAKVTSYDLSSVAE